MDRKTHINFWYIVAAILAIVLLQNYLARLALIQVIPYSQFQTLLHDGAIDDLTIGKDTITGTFRKTGDSLQTQFSTVRIDPQFAEELAKAGVKYQGAADNSFLTTILSWVLPTLLFFGIWMFLIRRLAGQSGFEGGLMSIGKSRAKVYVETEVKVTFADVAGVDEAKVELKEVVDFLKDPVSHGRLGAKVPKGVLLVGPPGTGKTLLARAIAGEAGVPFFSISGSEFVEMFVGVGAARVRDLFDQARKKAPAIIFIDELDALGRARGAFSVGGHDEKEQTLNQLLVELDGFDSTSGIILLAATNRPEILDPALLRSGRFDRQVLIDRPDRKGRIDILAVHVRKVKLDADVKLEEVAALTPGFTGADLANLVNEAALIATRHNAETIALADFTAAIERIVAGLEKRNRLLNPHEREVVAHHEMGHALVAMALPQTDPVQKISIIPRGIGSLGYTIQRPIEDRFLMTRAELQNKLCVLLAGRAAEAIAFKEISTGAADDIRKATDIARSIVTRYGMEPSLGNVAYEAETSPYLQPIAGPMQEAATPYSETTADKIDQAVRHITDEAFTQAKAILQDHRDVLLEGARLLLQKETLDKDELQPFVARMQQTAGRSSDQPASTTRVA
ncbi:MAG TPA: ATP-dependent zinc metalloprotease FtsH [Terriglobales bacterium]|nr:ATP-dependent zinc metalloprotease FtsH [Terriglobales bacterium]